MALTITSCFDEFEINYTYGDCCCSFNCTFTNDGEGDIEIEESIPVFDPSNFAIQSSQINYQGNIVSLPFTMAPNTSFQLQGEYCAGAVGDLSTLFFDFIVNGIATSFSFDFEAIDLSTSIDILSIDWGVVNINTINQVYLTINNPTTCCYNYDIQTDCLDTIISPSPTRKLCTDAFEAIQITWQPTTVGPVNCEVSVLVDCQTLVIPVTGFVNEAPTPPSGGNSAWSQKTGMDCSTGNCRLPNQQPGFAQAKNNAINQISRATAPKGGPGRGTNFGKK